MGAQGSMICSYVTGNPSFCFLPKSQSLRVICPKQVVLVQGSEALWLCENGIKSKKQVGRAKSLRIGELEQNIGYLCFYLGYPRAPHEMKWFMKTPRLGRC